MDYKIARHNMVENQVRTNKVTDPLVIAAMEEVPRELFLPENKRGIAYVDEDIPVGGGRYAMEPMVIARLMQEAGIARTDVALVIGAGFGYTGAAISRVAETVVAVESDKDMAMAAEKACQALNYDNVIVVEGDIGAGYAKQAPYNVIVFDGAVAEVPNTILDQLSEGGRMLVVVHAPGKVGIARLYERENGVVGHRDLFDANIPYLPGFEPAESFVF
ncbi:protein-L-isoaspartate O-methyltransferase family protein [Thalassospira alkalitolerans]|uniref:Protein-L-isoaspartate O-methyltransferase n=1 Tax=Thalassospira alkalitolerans TaxID=1293890 RepID=A0A1Y2L775_9PROT|nr:protein-L-isoaspartate O-methyltransferase [Thalassospira alkalitolerans]OSQ43568.1 protein-L-isoaspartate O-methyltransferase [Thalassospira alkalitolerans]|tara:strand:- start:41302 stop:41955 length:654 start_codon:yes stop_codon:yes gene_type:complete